MEQSFQQFSVMCENNIEKKYTQEILDMVSTSDCWFHPGMEGPRQQISSLYRFRFTIADKTNPKRTEFYEDYKNTVEKLEQSGSENIGITFLIFDSVSYLVFYEVSSQNICGILKSNKVDLEPRPQDIQYRSIPADGSPYFQKYSRGIRVN